MSSFGLTLSTLVLGGISLALGLLTLLISWAQTIGIQKYSTILSGVAGTPVAASTYYQMAEKFCSSLQREELRRGYVLPMAALFLTVLVCAFVSYFGAEWTSYLSHKNYLLGGIHVTQADSAEEILSYQTGTALVGVWAFIGAYVYIIADLLSRINNNDVSPITYYYYVSRIVVACLVAGVVRHALGFLDVTTAEWALLLVPVGFIVGWQPDLWIKMLFAKVLKRFGILGEQKDPDAACVPGNLSLLLIEGLTQDKRNRLEELDLDNCQALATHNPFILWARTSYQLLHVVDWIGQAQLCLLVKEVGIKELRLIGIRNIFGLECALAGQSKAQVAEKLGVQPEVCTDMLTYLRACPAFNRLKDVYVRLVPPVEAVVLAQAA
jgi:hypothetical protein